MNRIGKIAAGAVLAGVALGAGGGFLSYRAYVSPRRCSLEQSLWLIDRAGIFHSPTSDYTRAALDLLARQGVDIHARQWAGEVFINQTADPAVMSKTLRLGPPAEGARLGPE